MEDVEDVEEEETGEDENSKGKSYCKKRNGTDEGWEFESKFIFEYSTTKKTVNRNVHIL